MRNSPEPSENQIEDPDKAEEEAKSPEKDQIEEELADQVEAPETPILSEQDLDLENDADCEIGKEEAELENPLELSEEVKEKHEIQTSAETDDFLSEMNSDSPSNHEILDYTFRFLEDLNEEKEVNSVLAGYFSKLIMCLLKHKKLEL